MSILASMAVLSAGMVAPPQEPVNKMENREEVKAKILELLKKRRSEQIQEKPPVKLPVKQPAKQPVKSPVKQPDKEVDKQPEKEPVKQPEQVTDEKPLLSPDYLLKPAAFLMYLDKYQVEDKVVNVKINSPQDMYQFTTKMLEELPHTVNVTSDHYKPKELQALYEEAMSYKVEDLTPTMHGLASYSLETKHLKKLVIKDTANENYNAATIKKALDKYVQDIVPLLEGETEVETVNNIYDFMFNNFEYTAQAYREMMVGNLGYGEMACNGFSYLADQLFEEAGIKSYIRAGYSHFWNVLTLEDGREVTFDVTSDIVLDEYKATLGTSTKEHIEKTLAIGFYSAEYYNGKYHDVYEHQAFIK